MKKLFNANMLAGLALTSAFASHPVMAQDRQGNDTPGDWIVTHFKAFNGWESICDERDESGTLKQRCYVRYVDVFSPRPQFAAQFVFITPAPDNNVTIELGIEKGTLFKKEGIALELADNNRWSMDVNKCLLRDACKFDGEDANAITEAWSNPNAENSILVSDFTDRHGRPTKLEWDMSKFADALADFKTEANARNL